MKSTLLLSVSLILVTAALAQKGGTSILHWQAHATMTGTASGTVEAKLNRQGHADIQRLQISLAGLSADTTYQLLANGSLAGELTTDSSGNSELKYVKKNVGNGNAGGDPLPAALDPITGIHLLEISDGGTQTVLSAELHAGQYLVKRVLTNDGLDTDAAATLRIKSNDSSDQLRIRASGLDASATYYLAVDGILSDTLTSDGNGALTVDAWPVGAPAAVDVTGLAILNSDSNSVLSTTLP